MEKENRLSKKACRKNCTSWDEKHFQSSETLENSAHEPAGKWLLKELYSKGSVLWLTLDEFQFETMKKSASKLRCRERYNFALSE